MSLKKALMILAVLTTLAGTAAIAPHARASIPGEEGDVACGSASGRTMGSYGRYMSYFCSSYRTSFRAYLSGASGWCSVQGAHLHVTHIDGNNNYHPRWEGHICLDGFWHWSPPWGYNEGRVSEMIISDSGVDWAINQWQR